MNRFIICLVIWNSVGAVFTALFFLLMGKIKAPHIDSVIPDYVIPCPKQNDSYMEGMIEMEKNHKCSTCIYRCWLGNDFYCQYILVTGHVRGCSPVKCKRYKRGDPAETMDDTTKIISKKSEQTARRRTSKMDILHDRLMEMYNAGRNDHEISRELHVTPGSVLEWRRKNNLAPNATQGFESLLDKDLLMELYKKGMNDREISLKLGCTRNAIYLWRRKHGLKANFKK